MSTSILTACDPSQWVQSLVAIHTHVNQETYRYAIIKTILQGGLSAVTAVTCIPACGGEIIKLVGDVSCKATGGAIRGVQYINPGWLDSFYQIVSTRPSLSYRVERIIGEAFGLFISAVGTFFLLVLRNDWEIQQHQSLGNYIPSKTPPLETPEAISPSQTSQAPGPVLPASPPESSEEASPPQASQASATAPPPPPSAKAGTLLKSALKASPKTPTPLPDSASPSEGQATSSEPPPEESPASAETSSKEKKKGVHVISTPTNEAKPPSSPLDEIKRRGEQQSSKGEQIAAQLQKDESDKQGNKALSAEGKAISDALTSTKKKARRIQSTYFEDYKEGLGRPVQGGIILRDLQKELDIAFSEDESMLAKTFGEYILIKFAENNTPIDIAEQCELIDSWGKKFTIEILKIGKDTEAGKDIILQAAVDWKDPS